MGGGGVFCLSFFVEVRLVVGVDVAGIFLRWEQCNGNVPPVSP